MRYTREHDIASTSQIQRPHGSTDVVNSIWENSLLPRVIPFAKVLALSVLRVLTGPVFPALTRLVVADIPTASLVTAGLQAPDPAQGFSEK